jgi:predicted ATPase
MDNLTLRSLITENFKNLSVNEGLDLKNLNIFIGPNGSGKSNFVSVLKLLKDCVSASSDNGQDSSQFENAVAKLGGSKILDRFLKPPKDVQFSYHFSPTNTLSKGLNLELNLFVGAKDARVTIGKESLSDSSIFNPRPFYYYKFHDRKIGEGSVSVWEDLHERHSHFEQVANVSTNALGLTSLYELLEESKNPPERTPIYKVRREFIENVRQWHFFNANDMNLSEIRNSEPKLGPGDLYLSPSGHNLPLVLENLVQQHIEFEENLNYAAQSFLPLTRRVRAARTGLMSLSVQWHFKGTTEIFYLNEMSDGTVRMLCWAIILLSPQYPTLLVIDEPELGLHVAWMPILAEWIKNASRRTQVIICTHSPDLLDHFTDYTENVFCFSSEDKKHFSIKPLSKILIEDQLSEGWKLGDLYRVGDPNIGGWPW